MEINKDKIKQLTDSVGYEHFEELMREEMKKTRDVLDIKGENGREIEIEVIARQEAYKMLERLFRRVGMMKQEIKPPKPKSFK